MSKSIDKNKALVLHKLAQKREVYKKFDTKEKITWCGGCGDYGIQKALERAFILENLGPRDITMFFDIGCHGNGADKMGGVTTFHGLHGRVISAAAGAALANPKMQIIAQGGDGGTLSEGINHLIHAVRHDYPMLFILHNNENYGLTIGQASATTRCGQPMSGSPDGAPAEPMNAVDLVLGLKPSFVARTFSGDVEHMTQVIQAGLKHKGFAFIEIMQLCPTFNKATSQTWFLDRIRYVEDMKNYNEKSVDQARKAAEDLDKEIMMGILYRDPKVKPFLDRVPSRAGIKTVPFEEVQHYDIRKSLKQFE